MKEVPYVGEHPQPGHDATKGVCWWTGRYWAVRHGGDKPCTLSHTWGDPEPDPEAEDW